MSESPDHLYAPIEPFSTLMLPVSSRHRLYVERSGKPGGYPIFFLHGGPGSHTRAAHRRYFDPDFFEIVLFDQRGCGQSTPAGETRDNTTAALVEDIFTLREALGFDGRISLLGGSWGSALALAYALRYPETLDELILRGVFLGTDAELDWYTRGLRRFAPMPWQAFAADIGDDLIDHYYQVVFDQDDTAAMLAAARWVMYEQQLMMPAAMQLLAAQSLVEQSLAEQSLAEQALPTVSRDLLHRARVQLHYLKHRCFLAETPLLEAARTAQLPVTIVQGALDLVCPPVTAVELSQRLPQARLRLVSDAGHSAMNGSLAQALREECDALRDRLRRRDRD